MMTNFGESLTHDELRKFLTGGAATITIESQKTSVHYTYKIAYPWDAEKNGRDKQGPLFIKVLADGDRYIYAGILNKDGMLRIVFTTKSGYKADNPSMQALKWVLDAVNAHKLPAACNLYHHDHCAVCGRELTNPESVRRGIGPECWERMSA